MKPFRILNEPLMGVHMCRMVRVEPFSTGGGCFPPANRTALAGADDSQSRHPPLLSVSSDRPQTQLKSENHLMPIIHTDILSSKPA